MKCIAGAKVQLFCDTSVYYKTDSQKQNRENRGKQRLSDRSVPVNHPKFFEKLFSGVKVGLISIPLLWQLYLESLRVRQQKRRQTTKLWSTYLCTLNHLLIFALTNKISRYGKGFCIWYVC